MSFDLTALSAAVREHGRVARIVITGQSGSTPREFGTSMLVWRGGQSGTIGGGALEFAAVDAAIEALTSGDRVEKIALGPNIGQCCGGAVQLLTEVWDQHRVNQIKDYVARPLPGGPAEMPLKVANRLRQHRNGERPLRFELTSGWLIEPLTQKGRELWIWGAGHVGRALVNVIGPLPQFKLVWVDTAAARFPTEILPGATVHIAENPATLVPLASADAQHLIVTYSHALDLELCHQLLLRGFSSCGLIGSATKWARFRSRLQALGHRIEQIDSIDCPIGDPSLGKHPQAIAISVASRLIAQKTSIRRPNVAEGGC